MWFIYGVAIFYIVLFLYVVIDEMRLGKQQKELIKLQREIRDSLRYQKERD
jgi:uncharacterized membrane protein (DUF106 family)